MGDASTRWEFVFLGDDWDAVPTSSTHLAKRLLQDHHVTWLETIGLRSPRFHLYDVKRAFQKIASWTSKSPPDLVETPNLVVEDPFQIPYNQYGWVRGLNGALLKRRIRKTRPERTPGTRRVVVTTWPFLGDLVGRCDEDVFVYYRVDDFAEFPGVRREAIQALERETIEKVDLVVATAEKLTETHVPGKEVRYLPHGVDYEHFAAGRTDWLPTDHPILALPSPRIGFFGLLSEWIDLDLVAEIAEHNPQWSVVLVGPSSLGKGEHPTRDNLHYLGMEPYASLPHCAAAFDVVLIPFRISQLTLAVNPLKLREYFALGLPVVSTPLPEVEAFGDLVGIAADAETSSAAIADALANDTDELRERRRQVARESSWDARAKDFLGWLDEVAGV